jgi:hypothetical protein
MLASEARLRAAEASLGVVWERYQQGDAAAWSAYGQQCVEAVAGRESSVDVAALWMLFSKDDATETYGRPFARILYDERERLGARVTRMYVFSVSTELSRAGWLAHFDYFRKIDASYSDVLLLVENFDAWAFGMENDFHMLAGVGYVQSLLERHDGDRATLSALARYCGVEDACGRVSGLADLMERYDRVERSVLLARRATARA